MTRGTQGWTTDLDDLFNNCFARAHVKVARAVDHTH
jgi:hypothetical protein